MPGLETASSWALSHRGVGEIMNGQNMTMSTGGFWDRLDKALAERDGLSKEVDRLKAVNKRLRAENKALNARLDEYV
jgi:hypothetical protein